MKPKHLLLSLLLSLLLFSCQNKTKILCHRGSGIGFNINKGDSIYENTMDAVKFGFDNYDGIEIDIQKSKDGTLWVFHNSDFEIKDSLCPICIPNATDSEILILNTKLPPYKRLSRLEEVLKYRKSLNSNQYISLDIKGYFDTDCLSKRNVSKEYELNTANEIVRLINKYNLQEYVMVETDYLRVLQRVKALDSTISTFVLGYNNFNQRLAIAQKIKANGLSFNIHDTSLSQKAIERLHDKGMKIQVWTISSEVEKKKAKEMKADFIQTDR